MTMIVFELPWCFMVFKLMHFLQKASLKLCSTFLSRLHQYVINNLNFHVIDFDSFAD